MLQKDPEPHQEFHPARYLATHAMQKGAQAGTAAGLLFGTCLFALGRRGAITKYSTLGGLTQKLILRIVKFDQNFDEFCRKRRDFDQNCVQI